jgi:hypothetical protein
MSRQQFRCPKCKRSYPFLNVTLVRMVLQAIADGTGEVVFGQPAGTHPTSPRYVERLPNRGTARAWGRPLPPTNRRRAVPPH